MDGESEEDSKNVKIKRPYRPDWKWVETLARTWRGFGEEGEMEKEEMGEKKEEKGK